jgi:hypothetical protein
LPALAAAYGKSIRKRKLEINHAVLETRTAFYLRCGHQWATKTES